MKRFSDLSKPQKGIIIFAVVFVAGLAAAAASPYRIGDVLPNIFPTSQIQGDLSVDDNLNVSGNMTVHGNSSVFGDVDYNGHTLTEASIPASAVDSGTFNDDRISSNFTKDIELAEVSTDRLVMAHTFDNVSIINSTLILDSSYLNHDIKPVSDYVTTTSDGLGGSTAITFDGDNDTDSRLRISPFHSNLSQGFTVSVWTKFLGDRVGGVGVIAKQRTLLGAPFNIWRLQINGNDRFEFSATNSSEHQKMCTSAVYTANEWHYLVGVYNGSNILFYIDGEQDDETPYIADLYTTTDDQILIGQSSTGLGTQAVKYNGTIDELIVYNRALSADEVTTQYLKKFNQLGAPHWRVGQNGMYEEWNGTCKIIHTPTADTAFC